MSLIAVVYHSGYGHTQRMAQAVADGADAQLVAIDADGNLPDGGWETLLAAKAPGIIGAITGRAIYEGTLDVAEAQAFCDSFKG